MEFDVLQTQLQAPSVKRAKRNILQVWIKETDKGKAPDSEAQFVNIAKQRCKPSEPFHFVTGDLGPTYGPGKFRVFSVQIYILYSFFSLFTFR